MRTKIYFIILLSILLSCGKYNNSTNSHVVGKYLLSYSYKSNMLNISSIGVTPPNAGDNFSEKAGLFQVGNTYFDGLLITANIYLSNNSSTDWTGVEIQAYELSYGSGVIPAETDFGNDWKINNPSFGAFSWIFKIGNSFTISSGESSSIRSFGFDATSDFKAIVYIYANVPIITKVVYNWNRLYIYGYNLGTSQGAIYINGNSYNITSWSNTLVIARIPWWLNTGNVQLETNDSNAPFSNIKTY